jgi:hypothetical protein
LLILLPVLATSASAQGPGTKFGAIIGGASLSDMAGFAATSDSRWGGTAGFLVGVNTWRTSVTFEGTWIQKGGGDTRIDYIELPLTIGGIVPMASGAARGRFYSGISVGFKVSCSSDVLDCDEAKGTEWGWPIGLQFAKVTPTGSFFGFDVRYTVALSDAFDFNGVYNRPWVFRLMFGKVLGTTAPH